MRSIRIWCVLALLGVVTVGLRPQEALAFPEYTETKGTLPGDLSGIWFVVHHLKFGPSPQPTPAPGADGAADVEATSEKPKIMNVLNLLKIAHVPKAEADKQRAIEKSKLEASIAKAEAIIAAQYATSGEEGEEAARILQPDAPVGPESERTNQEDIVDVFLLDVAFPDSINESFEKAQKAQVAYDPSDKDLALLKSSWADLKPSGRDEYSKIEWEVVSADRFDRSLQWDENLRDAKFAITGNQKMIPRPNQPKSNVVVYGPSTVTDTRLEGNHVRAMMASAPFPIPIEFKGSFTAYKVADLPTDDPPPPAPEGEVPATQARRE